MTAIHSFCTLFDSNYLTRALVLYHSLVKTGEEFKLYAVCLDDKAYQILHELNLANLTAISLDEFETPQLRVLKSQRTAAEYCWTCTSHVIRYVLDTYGLPEVTYLDADLCFFAGPSLLFAEFNEKGASVLITEHRYTPQHDQSETSGIYCVQFMTFKSDARGMKVLQWWQDRCVEWCYARFEDGKFGDQKYLDDWPQRFEGVHVLQHLGGGAAPWNLQQYRLSTKANDIYINDYPLVFYHFHGYAYYKDGIHDFIDNWNYRISRKAVNLIYRPYAVALLRQHDGIRRGHPDFDCGFSVRRKNWKTRIRYLLRLLRGVGNQYRIVTD